MLDVHWTLTVDVPQLATLNHTLLTLGGQVLDQVQGIKDTLMRIEEQQAAAADALAEQVTIIATEVGEWNAGAITSEQIATLQAKLSQIATTAEQQAAQVRANSAQIAGIVPDAPPSTPTP